MIAELALVLALSQTVLDADIPIVVHGRVTIEKESSLRTELAQLQATATLTATQHARLAAIVAGLGGNIQNRCTVEQERALLCLRMPGE